LLALILNPFERLSCFGPKAGLNHFNCLDLLVTVRPLYRYNFLWPYIIGRCISG
jgi:hypothetical protein